MDKYGRALEVIKVMLLRRHDYLLWVIVPCWIPGTTFSLCILKHRIHYCRTCICSDLYLSHDIVGRSANTNISFLIVHIFSARDFL